MWKGCVQKWENPVPQLQTNGNLDLQGLITIITTFHRKPSQTLPHWRTRIEELDSRPLIVFHQPPFEKLWMSMEAVQKVDDSLNIPSAYCKFCVDGFKYCRSKVPREHKEWWSCSQHLHSTRTRTSPSSEHHVLTAKAKLSWKHWDVHNSNSDGKIKV